MTKVIVLYKFKEVRKVRRKRMHVLQAKISPDLSKSELERLILLEIANNAWPKGMVVQTTATYDEKRQKIMSIYLSFAEEKQAIEAIEKWTKFLESEALGGEKIVKICHCSRAQLEKILPTEIYEALSANERQVLMELRRKEFESGADYRRRRKYAASDFYNILH